MAIARPRAPDADEHHEADHEEHGEHGNRHREIGAEARQLVPRRVHDVQRRAGEILAGPVRPQLGVEIRSDRRDEVRDERGPGRPTDHDDLDRTVAARDPATPTRASPRTPRRSRTEPSSSTAQSRHRRRRATAVTSGSAPARPTRRTRASTTAQNASHVYCLRSLRMSDTGASITTSAATVAAKRASDRRRHPSRRANV